MHRIAPVRLVAAMCLAALSSSVSFADDRPSGSVDLALFYDVYWGGLPIAEIENETAVDGPDYAMTARIRTVGLLAWFVEARSTIRSEGDVAIDGRLVPARFETNSQWRGFERQMAIGFAADGAVTELEIDPEALADRDPVPEELRRGPDPMSLLLATVRALTEAAREEGASVSDRHRYQSFDGKRALEIEVACDRAAKVPEAVAARTAGEGIRCEVGGRMVAGFHHKYRDRPLTDEEPAIVWAAPLEADGILVPLKVELPTRFGSVVVLLRDPTGDGAPAGALEATM